MKKIAVKILEVFGISMCIALLGIPAWIIVGVIISTARGMHSETEIVKHHAAHYEMDPTTGHSTFHWNDEGKP